jgi:hypothetical protein
MLTIVRAQQGRRDADGLHGSRGGLGAPLCDAYLGSCS